jgi:hypothetical protein
MRWAFSLILSALVAAGPCPAALGQDLGHLESLLTKLDDAKATRDARSELRTLAAQDPDSRQYIAQRLPSLIAIALCRTRLARCRPRARP